MEKINFYYDPQRQGYDQSTWKTIAGTPAISSSLLRMNTATAVGYADIYSADLTVCATFPLAPVAGQDKRIGFAQLNKGAYVGFKMLGDKFYIESVSPDTTTVQTEITWKATWTAVPVAFRVLWENNQVKFYVKIVGDNDEALVGRINDTVALPKSSLSLYLHNGDGDNLDISYVDLRDAAAVFPNAPIEIAIQDIQIGAVELKDATTDTRSIINAANTARTATDPVLLTQPIDAAGNVISSDAAPTTLTGGTKTVAVSGTAEALGTSLAIKSAYLRAPETNTGNIYVGDSSVDKTTNQQLILEPGDYASLDIANRSTIYLDVDTGGEGVDYLLAG